jgi:putative nucleotidyltransferase with HDIG domain
VKRTIRLRGLNGPFKGQSWEADELLRIGRLGPQEVVLDDNSVSRNHAEIRHTDRGWRLRDLGSTNGTRLNGVRLSAGQWPLRVRDLIQFGEVAIVVEALNDVEDEPDSNTLEEMCVEASAKSSWDEALEGLAFDSQRCPRAGEQLLALLRAGHHLVHIEKEEELLNSILNDAVGVLDAQRGAIVLAEGPENKLKLKALVTGRGEPRALISGRDGAGGRFQFSQSLAKRCVSRGESILCHRVEEDPELAMAKSIAEGAMASVLCVLLRTPRKRLGVLHLDRSPWQKPFTMDDLHLADALAANVSAGIECAQLVRKQRDLFLDTITILAQAVEMRDEYTGGHTLRVSTYSILLAQELRLSSPDVELIRIGTPLHDIGKIGIDDSILRKPERLTAEEFEIMKTHTVKGAEIVSTVPDLRPIIPTSP